MRKIGQTYRKESLCRYKKKLLLLPEKFGQIREISRNTEECGKTLYSPGDSKNVVQKAAEILQNIGPTQNNLVRL